MCHFTFVQHARAKDVTVEFQYAKKNQMVCAGFNVVWIIIESEIIATIARKLKKDKQLVKNVMGRDIVEDVFLVMK